MSDSKSAPKIEELAEGNPMVDQSQVQEAHEALMILRRAGLSRPSYRIDSPYERGPTEGPEPVTTESDSDLLIPPRSPL